MQMNDSTISSLTYIKETFKTMNENKFFVKHINKGAIVRKILNQKHLIMTSDE